MSRLTNPPPPRIYAEPLPVETQAMNGLPNPPPPRVYAQPLPVETLAIASLGFAFMIIDLIKFGLI